MESFVRLMAPIAIALFGFVVMWGIVRMISNREDPAEGQEERPVDSPHGDR